MEVPKDVVVGGFRFEPSGSKRGLTKWGPDDLLDSSRLRAALMQSYQQSGGYLPPKEVVQLSLAFNTVYHLGLDEVGRYAGQARRINPGKHKRCRQRREGAGHPARLGQRGQIHGEGQPTQA